VQRLNHRLIIVSSLVYGDIAHAQHQSRIVAHMHVDFRVRELYLLQGLLHLRLPLLHQRVKLRHRSRVAYRRRRPRLMQILNGADPPSQLLRLLVGLLD